MDIVVKIIGVGLIALVISMVLKQYKPDMSIYISLIAGCIIMFMVIDKLGNIVQLLKTVASKIEINNGFLDILLKITGIAILSEIAISLCKDAGESSLANKIEIGTKVIIISFSLPIISSLLELVIKILP